jgi:hypothetical protein
MLLALTGGETVLVVVAGVFIAFALVVSMLVPRRWPEFPGHRVGLFALVVLILFAGMLTAVVTATGGEEHGGEVAHETPPRRSLRAARATPRPALPYSRRPAASVVTRWLPPKRPAPSARTSTRRSRITTSSSNGSRTARE